MTDAATHDFTGLRATFVNCTLKKSPEISNTSSQSFCGFSAPQGSIARSGSSGRTMNVAASRRTPA